MGRSPCCDKNKVKRGPWSPEEDSILKNHIQNHGTGGNWIALPHKAGLKRCGKSCRLRWLNYLRPDIKLGGFTEEEDNIISTLYINIGSRWSVIASHLRGRTDNDVKNHWNTKLKKKLSGSPSNTITATSTATCISASASTTTTHNPMQFSVMTTPAFLPKQEDKNYRIMDNAIIDYSTMMDYQQNLMTLNSKNNSFSNSLSSSQENQGMSPNAISMGNEYASWYGNGSGVMDSGGDFLIGELDFRHVIGELADFNYPSEGL